MAVHLEVDAELTGPGVEASLVRMQFTQLSTTRVSRVLTQENVLNLYLQPESFNGEFRCTECGMEDFAPAMPVRFRPAEIEFEWRHLSGKSSMLNYAFSRERMRQALDDDFVWLPEEIERGCNLIGSKVVPLLRCVLNEITNPGLASATYSDSLSTIIIVELVRYLRGQEPEELSDGRLAPVHLRRIRERLEENIVPPTVGELAGLCSMSERNLLRLFKGTTGETIAGYVKRMQADRACSYLTATEMPLKEIAFRLGFMHTSSFAVAFRRIIGETPGNYRRSFRNSDRLHGGR